MSSEVKFERALTGKSLVIGGILTFIASLYFSAFGYFNTSLEGTFGWGPGGAGKVPGNACQFILIGWVVFTPIIITAILNLFKVNVSRSELAVIYTMVSITPMVLAMSEYTYALCLYNSPQEIKDWMTPYFPSILGPQDPEVLNGMITGGAPVLWGPWLPTMGYIFLRIASCYLFFMFLSNLLRRQYIEIESLPFPLATYAMETIDMATSKTDTVPKLFKAGLFWLGALISFIFGVMTIPILQKFGVPTFYPEYDLTPMATGVAGVLCFVLQPYAVGFGYLLGFDILITTILASLILLIIVPNIIVTMGLGTFNPNNWFNYLWGLVDGLGYPANASPYAWGYNGMIWGIIFSIAIYPVIIHRRVFIESIKAVFQASPTSAEANEPFRYRVTWIGIIIFGLLWLSSFVIAGVPPQYAILGIIWITIWFTAFARFQGESGMVLGGWFSGAMAVGEPHKHWFVQATGLRNSNPAGAVAFDLTFGGNERGGLALKFGGSSGGWLGPYNGTMARTLENYRIGYLAKAKPLDIFVSQAIAIIVSLVISIIVGLWWWYTFGLRYLSPVSASVLLGRYTGERNFINTGSIGRMPYPNEFTLVMFIIGVALTVTLYFLRARYTGFMMNPIGILIALTTHSFPVWFSFLVALIAKWLTFRVGGATLYERKGLPVACGLIAGICFAYALGSFVNVLSTLYII